VRFAVDGHEIDFEAVGEGRPVVFLHGLTLDRRLLRGASEAVFERADGAPGWRRFYLDLPGHGASSGDPEHASADEMVAALSHFFVAVAGEGAALVASAYGAYLALGLARDVPLSGLFLVAPVVEPDVGRRTLPPQRTAVQEEGLVFADETERELFLGEVAVQTASSLRRFRSEVQPAHQAADPRFVAALRRRYAMARPWSSELSGFARPVAIVCGRDDYWVGFEDPCRLARIFPRAELTVAARGVARTVVGYSQA